MASPPAAPPVAADHRPVWRATQKDLWVARRDGRHLGTVECGRRFLATDVDGEPIGVYRTLEAAMRAVTEPGSRTRRRARPHHSWWPLLAAMAIAAATTAGAYALLLV